MFNEDLDLRPVTWKIQRHQENVENAEVFGGNPKMSRLAKEIFSRNLHHIVVFITCCSAVMNACGFT